MEQWKRNVPQKLGHTCLKYKNNKNKKSALCTKSTSFELKKVNQKQKDNQTLVEK